MKGNLLSIGVLSLLMVQVFCHQPLTNQAVNNFDSNVGIGIGNPFDPLNPFSPLHPINKPMGFGFSKIGPLAFSHSLLGAENPNGNGPIVQPENLIEDTPKPPPKSQNSQWQHQKAGSTQGQLTSTQNLQNQMVGIPQNQLTSTQNMRNQIVGSTLTSSNSAQAMGAQENWQTGNLQSTNLQAMGAQENWQTGNLQSTNLQAMGAQENWQTGNLQSTNLQAMGPQSQHVDFSADNTQLDAEGRFNLPFEVMFIPVELKGDDGYGYGKDDKKGGKKFKYFMKQIVWKKKDKDFNNKFVVKPSYDHEYKKPSYDQEYKKPSYGYQSQQPSYAAPAPAPMYGKPSSGYQSQPSSYAAPAPAPMYGKPSSAYQSQQPSYAAPAPAPMYSKPSSAYQSQQPSYAAPAPAPMYGKPSSAYQSQQSSYAAPAPAPMYGKPSSNAGYQQQQPSYGHQSLPYGSMGYGRVASGMAMATPTIPSNLQMTQSLDSSTLTRQSFDAADMNLMQQVPQSPCSCSNLQPVSQISSTPVAPTSQNVRNFNPVDPFDDSVDQQVKLDNNRANDSFGAFDDFPKDQVDSTIKTTTTPSPISTTTSEPTTIETSTTKNQRLKRETNNNYSANKRCADSNCVSRGTPSQSDQRSFPQESIVGGGARSEVDEIRKLLDPSYKVIENEAHPVPTLPTEPRGANNLRWSKPYFGVHNERLWDENGFFGTFVSPLEHIYFEWYPSHKSQ